MIALFLAFSNLPCSGDVEINPGPSYSILKIIPVSFHQDNSRIDHIEGMQCACSSVYALCWPHVKKVYQSNANDL